MASLTQAFTDATVVLGDDLDITQPHGEANLSATARTVEIEVDVACGRLGSRLTVSIPTSAVRDLLEGLDG